jgi:hypothetical protein
VVATEPLDDEEPVSELPPDCVFVEVDDGVEPEEPVEVCEEV